jgi:hypothetical protein
MGKPKSVFQSFENQQKEEIEKPIENNVFDDLYNYFDNTFTVTDTGVLPKTETEIIDSSKPEILDDSYLTDDFFKNDENKINSMSFEIIPSNFKIIDNRIKGTVIVKSSEKTYDSLRLHTFFSPLDLKQNVFNQKLNDLHFKTDLTETIEINETANNYKNLSIKIHVMGENGTVFGKEIFIDVLDSDSQDMPVKENKKIDDKMLYIIAGIGILGLALIIKRIRKK